MPMTVFLIGVLSMVLILSLRLIFEAQRDNSNIVDAIMGMETNTAIYHLRIQEFVGGVPQADVEGGVSAVDHALVLADGLLNGGANSRFGLFSRPLKPWEWRARLLEIRSLLMEFRQLGLLSVSNPRESGAGSVHDRQFDVLFNRILEKTTFLEHLYKESRIENRQRMRILFIGIYLVWTVVVIAATAGLWRIELRRKAAEESLLDANRELLFQAEELAAHRENLAGLVEQRTAELTAANEQLRVENAERREAEESLRESEKLVRALSSRLLRAQEIERRRISMELHDELGQAMNAVKLRIRLIEKGLLTGQEAAREECESLLGYLDKVIEDVRRLSLYLSPAILEDLGLTSALRWLVSDFMRVQDMAVTSDIAEIDDLVPENHRVTIYRVVQEALTNIGRHARAQNVSVLVRRLDDKVAFTLEDDGKGFDPAETSMREASEKGLGLTTMNERVRMMGGVFELWSRKGEGTRISFSIPVCYRGA
jgi:signal transduction histidine kinase